MSNAESIRYQSQFGFVYLYRLNKMFGPPKGGGNEDEQIYSCESFGRTLEIATDILKEFDTP